MEEYSNTDKIALFRFLLKSIAREAHFDYANTLRDSNAIVSPNQSEALGIINHYGPISLKDVGSLLISEKKSPSRLIQTLVDKKLVTKTNNPTDKRLNVLVITPKGQDEIKKIKCAENKFYQIISKKLLSEGAIDDSINIFTNYIKGTSSYDKIKHRFKLQNKEQQEIQNNLPKDLQRTLQDDLQEE